VAKINAGKCPLCGKENIIQIPDEVALRVVAWSDKGRPGFIQDQFPELTIGQREAIISGTHGECFDAAFGEED